MLRGQSLGLGFEFGVFTSIEVCTGLGHELGEITSIKVYIGLGF